MKKMYQLTALIVFLSIRVLFAPSLQAQFVRQGPKLIGTGAVGRHNNQRVRSVALSAYGNTLIVVPALRRRASTP
jgi:hypothetical protein